jgi:Zn-dependent protease with chaperone function
MKFYPIYLGVFHAIERLHENMAGIWYLTMKPAIAMYSFFINSFTEAESKLSRERELTADNEAIKSTNATVFSSALIKSILIISIWIKAVNETEEEVSSLPKVEAKEKTVSYFYQLLNNIDVMQYCTEQLLDKSDFHPFDSHPTLESRLKNMGINLKETLPTIRISKFDHDFVR